jgi:hypothetical protein
MGLNISTSPLGFPGSQQLTVLAVTRTQTETGGWTEVWDEVGTVYGWVTQPARTSMMERVMGEQPLDAEIVEITANDTVGIVGSNRVRDAAGVTYEVVGVQRQMDVVVLAGRRV